MRFPIALVGCLVLLSAATAGVVGTVTTHSGQAPEAIQSPPSDREQAGVNIHSIYPDPVASGDKGEFVVLDVPDGTNLARYTLTDGDTLAALPARTTGGKVAVTADPDAVRNLTDRQVVEIETAVRLANGGDSVTLRRDGNAIDSVSYSDSTEGELAFVHGSTLRWRPLGATDRPIVTGNAGSVRAFTLPDAPQAPVGPIRNATDRVYIAGYTLSSSRVADALIAAHGRGVEVRILLEGDPVGGRTRTEAETLDRLRNAGIELRVVAGTRARYRYHHAKYAVADNRAVVLTENWKPAGTGGSSSRGWGVTTGQSDVVDGLAATFRADIGWQDAVSWQTHREGRSFQQGETATESYPSRFDAATVPVNRTALLVTPDNAQGAIVTELDTATDSIDVIQPTVGGWDEPLLRALRRAARRGVEVRLLLSSAWYVREDNKATVERFEAWADRTDAPLSAKRADPNGRFGKIHAKGAVIDGNRVILGSLNWNEQAATENREVVLVLHGTAVADYYGRVFDADWSGGKPSVPLDIGAAVVGVTVIGGLAARRVRFAS